jgi:hypothetical protein
MTEAEKPDFLIDWLIDANETECELHAAIQRLCESMR